MIEVTGVDRDAVVGNVGSGRAGPTLTKVYRKHGDQHWLLADRAVPARA